MAVDRGVTFALDAGFDEARRLSSGTFSLAMLAAMDHPYARRHGKALLDPATINVQTGAFFQHWRTTKQADGGQIRNDDEKADFLKFGTETMVERPIEDEVEAFVASQIEGIIADQIASVFR